MLAALETRPLGGVIHAGTDQLIVRWKDCPDCGGYGWFCVDPFAQYNKEYRQCATCKTTHSHYLEHGELPTSVCEADPEGEGE